MIAYYIFVIAGKNPNLPSNQAYGMLVSTTLPKVLSGFFAAVMAGAILSSFNSALNATCTLFSLGIYKEFINKEATDKQVVNSGKYFGFIIAICAMLVAPFLGSAGSIFAYLQKIYSIFFIPIYSVVLIGMLTKRTPAWAANRALIGGVIVLAIAQLIPSVSNLIEAHFGKGGHHFVCIIFYILLIYMFMCQELYGTEKPFEQEDVKAVDLTPWKYSKQVGIALHVIIAIIYLYFAR